MEVANASLLDEATAAAEAMTMLHRVQPRSNADAQFFVADSCFPQTLDVLRARARAARHRARRSAILASGGARRDALFGALVQIAGRSGRGARSARRSSRGAKQARRAGRGRRPICSA